MPEEKPRSAEFDPRDALADVESASGKMVESTEAPRVFMVVFTIVITSTLALFHAVPWFVTLGTFGLLIPLGAWYYLLVRARAKGRPVIAHSGRYMGFFMLLVFVSLASSWWEARLWWEVPAKWVVLFVLFGFCISRMRTAAIADRRRDANERPV